jgi:uncharacterized protein (DUF1501 family)
MGTTTLFSSLVHLGAMGSMSAQAIGPGDPYKALVCILLAGGNDSFNLVVPTEGGEYVEYDRIRSDLALPRGDLLPLNVLNTPGRTFGLHPSMPRVQHLFNEGRAAVITNVGTLVEPVTLPRFQSGVAKLPLGLFSHADQIQQWQTALPDARAATGWGGRLADVVSEGLESQQISMNISLGGINTFQSGRRTSSFAISEKGDGGVSIQGYGDDNPLFQLRDAVINSLLNAEYANIFERAYVDRLQRSIDGNQFFSAALASIDPPSTDFDEGRLSQQLLMVARTIAARQLLGANRQTFFVLLPDFDHHDEVIANQAGLLALLDEALGSFFDALVELGIENDVVTFTVSDFGRTLSSNGRGSDHGWGGNQIVLGGPVRGARFYGDYPGLAAGNPLDTGRGRLIPTTSVDEYFAELALWFGVAHSDLEMVLPNVSRFYSTNSSVPPLGFVEPDVVPPPLRRPPIRSRSGGLWSVEEKGAP